MTLARKRWVRVCLWTLSVLMAFRLFDVGGTICQEIGNQAEVPADLRSSAIIQC